MTTETTQQPQKICIADFTAMDRRATEYFIDKAIKISLSNRFPTHILHTITEYAVTQTETREFDAPFDPGTNQSDQYLKKD